jgi:hypothetical protein
MTYFCHVGATAATLKWEGGGGRGRAWPGIGPAGGGVQREMYEVGPGGGGSTGVIVYSTVHTKLHVLHGEKGGGGDRQINVLQITNFNSSFSW